MEKLNRITLLDDSKRPKAPRIEGITASQRAHGKRLSWFHRLHRAQLANVRNAMERTDAADVADKVKSLQMGANYRMFGNLCGEECQMLTFHHSAEDYHIFPVLHREGSEGLRKVVERLAAEHLVVHELIEELEGAARDLVREPSPENFARAKATFQELEKCVHSHFGYEETELEEALGVIEVGI